MRYDWSEYDGAIPVAFLNCSRKAELLRRSLGLLDERLLRFLFDRGLNFALCTERHTPSLTLSRWYPYEQDEWARHYFGSSYDEAWGWYDTETRTVIATKRQTMVTLVHEVGHAVDFLLGDVSARFFRPGYGVTRYAETDSREFWAEAFEHWFCPWGHRDRVARAHPDFPALFNQLGDVVSEHVDLSKRLG